MKQSCFYCRATGLQTFRLAKKEKVQIAKNGAKMQTIKGGKGEEQCGKCPKEVLEEDAPNLMAVA